MGDLNLSIDKYYTTNDNAQKCIALVPNINDYDCIIEPSAGNGAFSSQLNNCIAYDIEPEHSDIIQKDWFLVQPITNKQHILVIGNPPFGKRSQLAKKIIKHAQNIGAETIAFILPNTFSKLTNQSLSLFPEDWKLIVEHPLQSSVFITEDNKEYYVPCSFYVWTKQDSEINLRQVKELPNKDFSFLSRGDITANFSINGNSGKVKELQEITNPKAEHYIKSNIDVDILKQRFQNLHFNFLSSVNGKNAWIGQQDILKAYNKIYK